MSYHIFIGKLIGTTCLKVNTEYIEEFLHFCQKNKIFIWNVKQLSANEFKCHIYLYQATELAQLMEQSNMILSITITEERGIYPMARKLLKRKGLLFITLVCLCLLLFLSNVIWKVNISGVTIEQQETIENYLESVGIRKGNFIFQLPKTDHVENDILINMEELLYISIVRQGTMINVKAKEKNITHSKSEKNYQKLVAKKSGLIDKMLIKHGFPIVHTNDYVNKGDLLAVNEIEDDENTSDKRKDDKELNVEGEVYANTWYEMEISTPLSYTDEKLRGQMKKAYSMKLGTYKLPLWPIKQQVSENQLVEEEKIDVHFLRWKTPFKLIKSYIYDIDIINKKQSVKLTKEYAIQQATNHLQLKLGMKSEINHYFILHESVDENKVTLKIFVSVLEDIAEGR